MFKWFFPYHLYSSGFLGDLIGGVGSVIGGLLGFEGQKDTNATNAMLSRENMEWMSGENLKQREFNAAQALLDREFQADQAAKTRKFSNWQGDLTRQFNAQEAANARSFNERMSNTQYQRAVKDMMAAGLNPMLLASRAGGAQASGPAATSSAVSSAGAVSGSRATAGSTGAPNLARMENVFSSAANVANSIAVIGRAIAETQQVEAQIDVSKAQALNVAEDTKLKAALGHESFWRSVKTQAEETKIYKEIEKLQADIIHSGTSAEKLRSITKLLDLSIPKAVNEAMAEDTWWKRNVSPFLKDASSSGNILQHLPIFRMLKK